MHKPADERQTHRSDLRRRAVASRGVTFSSQPLGELGERLPARGVHVDVLLVADILVVDDVVVHPFGP